MSSSTLEAFLVDGDAAFQRRIERMPEPAAKTCTVCGASFGRKPTEVRDHYHKRSTCSQECLRVLRQRAPSPRVTTPKPLAERTCPVCGQRFQQRPHEALTRFMERQTCSSRCGATLRWQERRVAPRQSEPSDEELDRRAEIILARMAEQRAA